MLLEQTLVQAMNEGSLLVSKLSASKDYIDKVISSMAEALLVTTKSGNIKTANESALNLFGYLESELIGQPISTIIDDEIFLDLIENGDQWLTNKSLKNLEVFCKNKNGRKIAVEFFCSTIQTDLEDLPNYIYIGRDVTERQRSERSLLVQYDDGNW